MLRSRRARSTRRAGFTLLEILLATLIASLLLAALYLAMSVTLRQTQTSRDASEVEDLSRGIFNKMTVDLSGTLAPLPPRSGGNPLPAASTTATSSATTPSTGGTTTPTVTGTATGSGGSTTPATSTGSTTTPSTTTTPTTTTSTDSETDNPNAGAADFSFQGGVSGTEKQIVVFAGRVPEAFGRFGNPGDQIRADQRQIIYWLGPSGGLYRQERPWVTADGVRNSLDPDPEAADAVLVAEEVSDVSFEYTDGSAWTTEWDGTVPGPDGVTPLGPPRAIRVTLVLKIPTGKSNETVEKRLTQVIAVRAAPGTNTPTFIEPPIDGATDTTTSGTTGGTTTPSTGGTQPSTGSGTTGGNSSGGSGGTTTPSTGGTRPSTGTTTGGSMGGSTGGKSGGGK
ncbi:prepilin-type N-terminal cleavage/methylation domain-containing protein [Gemmata sp. G18]|uniref:Prepilin-type N-terminal cleavage/methylation domain-containing protein n=1 Tax=Gemmata palustris TaxID=2822762 RepID=A0ABS5C0F9_9BACT|nr:prepilin-type N-terminal cleavage/methylation domain-containing protein [Gemmata palustris]MBP3959470.1 prepilin-type N-terminal cleavage/methylation domain-containing protein [Gemmata palustris]